MATREEEEGVLLYYKYVSIPDVSELLRFYKSNCDSLHLLGRVRLAPDGVNVTVGGKLSALEKHILTIKSNSLFEGTDFKLASCHSPSNDRVAQECGFTSLSIRVVKLHYNTRGYSFSKEVTEANSVADVLAKGVCLEELVTFSSQPLLKSPSISNAGRHLSANEFHSVLQNAGNALDSTQDKRLVLLDARNVYETRIGKFHTPNAETLDPKIRQYSDLPAWIDNHSKQLQGNRVLMYCTGGIRCEMASAYIRSKGVGFENVFQLFGGIQRYLEQFPDGGFFKGKNFVFDHRIAVGSSNADVLGSCLVCGSSFDDYSSRCRCTYCRMLVLVCDGCQGEGSATYICELCRKHGKGDGPVLMMENENFNSRSKCGGSEVLKLESATLSDHSTSFPELPLRDGGMPPRKLRILCLHGFRQNASNFKGRTASLAKKLKNIAEFVYVDAPHELPFIYQPRPTKPNHGSEESLSPRQMNDVNKASQDHPPSLENCKKRFAWLVAPKFDCPGETDWKAADKPFDPLQYQHQTDGFEESYDYLKTVYSQMGPFDGVLGFSQGAAMAALLCAQRGRDDSALCFRFAILCSGFQIFSENVVWGSSINCPSLHIFGGGEHKDRQIARSVSMELTHLFDEGSSVVMEHESGHIIPTQSPYIDRIKDFLQRFC